jgi:hypothetical protein
MGISGFTSAKTYIWFRVNIPIQKSYLGSLQMLAKQVLVLKHKESYFLECEIRNAYNIA